MSNNFFGKYRGTVSDIKDPLMSFRIKAKVRKEAKTKTGDHVRVRFTVLDRADVTIPTDLMKALRARAFTRSFAPRSP